jgi:hypothetical protein
MMLHRKNQSGILLAELLARRTETYTSMFRLTEPLLPATGRWRAFQIHVRHSVFIHRYVTSESETATLNTLRLN